MGRLTTKTAIRFVLNGDVVYVRDVDPTQSVLNYLREDLRRTGTKEGCAEGDCGACTVVLGEVGGPEGAERLRWLLEAAPARFEFMRKWGHRPILREDMEAMGPVRLKEVDESQMEIVTVAKGLADRGEIMLSDNGDDDELIY